MYIKIWKLPPPCPNDYFPIASTNVHKRNVEANVILQTYKVFYYYQYFFSTVYWSSTSRNNGAILFWKEGQSPLESSTLLKDLNKPRGLAIDSIEGHLYWTEQVQYLSIYLSTYLYIYISIYLYIYLSVSIYPSIHLCLYFM